MKLLKKTDDFLYRYHRMYMRLKRTQGIFLHYPYEIIAFMRHIIHRVTFSAASYLFALST